jgi:hypothetical protein
LGVGVGVGVDAANVAVGRPPSAAIARAAEKIQTRIKGLCESEPVVGSANAVGDD